MSQEVMGMTAFWAILALALNAMARPSFTIKMLFGSDGMAKGSLIPHLSSPTLCFVDCLVQLVVLVKVLYRLVCNRSTGTLPHPTSSTASQESKHESIAVRVVLFILGGFPQSVKIFGMRGIPATQTLCSVYLASTILGAISELLSRRAKSAEQDLEAWWEDHSQWHPFLKMLIIQSHVLMTIVIWNSVAHKIHLIRANTNEDFSNLCEWIEMIVMSLAVLATFLWIMGVFFAPGRTFGKWKHGVSPFVASLPFGTLIAYPKRLLKAGDRITAGQRNPTTVDSLLWVTAPLLLVAAIGCYALAVGLVRLANVVSGTQFEGGHHLAAIETDPQSSQPAPQLNYTDNATQTILEDSSILETNVVSTVRSNIDRQETESETALDALTPSTDTPRTPQTDAAQTEMAPVSHPDAVTSSTDPQTVAQTHTASEANALQTSTPNTSPTNEPSPKPEPDPVSTILVTASLALLLPFNNNLQALHTVIQAPDSDLLTDFTSTTHGTWILHSSFFRTFRNGIPAALTYRWKRTPGSTSNKAIACVRLVGQIAKLFALQSACFAFLAVANACNFSAYGRLVGGVEGRRVDFRVQWVFFAVLNLVTAVVYYSVVFDGTGTKNPGWTGVLGRK